MSPFIQLLRDFISAVVLFFRKRTTLELSQDTSVNLRLPLAVESPSNDLTNGVIIVTYLSPALPSATNLSDVECQNPAVFVGNSDLLFRFQKWRFHPVLHLLLCIYDHKGPEGDRNSCRCTCIVSVSCYLREDKMFKCLFVL